jgi:hypothetical protein
MLMSLAGSGTKNDCPGEEQNQFIRPTDRPIKEPTGLNSVSSFILRHILMKKLNPVETSLPPSLKIGHKILFHEKITGRLNSDSGCYHSVQNLLSSRLPAINKKTYMLT